MKKIFTFIAAMLVAFAVNAQTPSTDFAAPGYTFVASAATLDGYIAYNSESNYLYYTDHDVNGTATWNINATNTTPCEINVVLHVGGASSTSGHQFKVEVFDSSDALVGSAQELETSWKGNRDINASGSIILPGAGSYTVVLSNLTSWSATIINSITLVGKSIPTKTLAGANVFGGADATLSGNIWYDSTNDYLYYNDKSVCGDAIWVINATRACYVTATLNFSSASTTGHKCGVEVFDIENKSVGSLGEASQSSAATDVALTGSILIPKAGIYKVVLSNATGWSSSKIDGITLTGDPIYTVAGDNTTVFGTAWDATNAANDMNDVVDGKYMFVKKNVDLTAGSIELKVVEDHAWTTSHPGSNHVLNIPADGNYDIRVYYNKGAGQVTSQAISTTPQTVMLEGSFTATPWEGVTMVDAEDHLSCSYTIGIAPGYYEFKILDGATWYGADGVVKRTDCTNWTLLTGTGNIGFIVDVDAQYKFVYTYATHKLDVIYPTEFIRTTTSDLYYQTLCVPFDATISNADFYEITGEPSPNGVQIGVPNLAYMVHGKSYIIKPRTNANMVITMKEPGNQTVLVDNPTFGASGLYGFLANDVYGEYDQYPYHYQWDWAVYLLLNNEFHFIGEGASATIGSTRAYLHMPAPDPNAAPAVRIIMEGQNATDIQAIEASEKAIKFIQNGQLFILKDGVTYDMTGRAVK